MVEFGCRQLHPSVGAHRQAHCSTSGPRQTRVEAPVHPIHHRRAHACAQRCAAIPPDLQCESRLRSLLDSALGLCDAERTGYHRHALDGLPGGHRDRPAIWERNERISQILTSYVWTTSTGYCLYSGFEFGFPPLPYALAGAGPGCWDGTWECRPPHNPAPYASVRRAPVIPPVLAGRGLASSSVRDISRDDRLGEIKTVAVNNQEC